MLQYLNYGLCLLTLLLGYHASQATETKEFKVLKALALSLDSVSIARTLLTEYFPSNHTDYNNILKHLNETENQIFEVAKILPICDVTDESKPVDCSEVLAKGNNETGMHTIWPRGRLAKGNPLEVYCDMEFDGGGWTVIQKRANVRPQEDFYVDWEHYKKGFGDMEKDFWLGNENIHALTNQKEYEILFDLEASDGERGFARYNTFWIDSEDSDYTLHISNYTGNIGDAMKHHNNLKFSTKDRGITQYAEMYKGGWWYSNWAHSNLNGEYKTGEDSIDSAHWWYWRQNQGLERIEMKVKPR